MERAILRDGETPFELLIERLCQRYHKLPSEVLNEDYEWIDILYKIIAIDYQKEKGKQIKSELASRLQDRL